MSKKTNRPNGRAPKNTRKTWQRLITPAALLLVLVVGLLLTGCGGCAGCAANKADGTCGEKMKWSLSANGILTLSGSGDMTSYATAADAPWKNNAADIREVHIGKDITSVSVPAFLGCTELSLFRVDSENTSYTTECGVLFTKDMKTLVLYTIGADRPMYEIPAGVTSVGSRAFSGDDALTILSIPASVTSIALDAFDGCTSLTEVKYGGTAEAYSAMTAGGSPFGNKVTVTCTNADGSSDSGLNTSLSYEFYAASEKVERVNASLLKDSMTVYIAKGGSAYIEFTVLCEQAGIFGFTMKGNHQNAKIDYLRLKNLSVRNFNLYATGQRTTESPEAADLTDLSPNDYCITADAFRGDYSVYSAYTYLIKGTNRIRLWLTSGGTDCASLGLYSFRLDMITPDTENTMHFFATDEKVTQTIGTKSQYTQGNYDTGYCTRGSTDKTQLTFTVPADAAYDVYALGVVSNFTIKDGTGSDAAVVMDVQKMQNPYAGSQSAGYFYIGTTDTLTAGKHELVVTSSAYMSYVMFMLVPQGEEPLPKAEVSDKIPLNVADDETDLMKDGIEAIRISGVNTYQNGVLHITQGEKSPVYITVDATEAGLYLFRFAGMSSAQTIYLANTSLKNGGDASRMAVVNVDASRGWQRGSDGYADTGFEVYLNKGKNELKLFTDGELNMTGLKMKKIANAPNLLLVSTDFTYGDTAEGGTNSTYMYTVLANGDTLTYRFTIDAAGTYNFAGLLGGGTVTVTLYNGENRVFVRDITPRNSMKIGESAFGAKGATVYTDITSETLTPGNYTLVLTGGEDTSAAGAIGLTSDAASDKTNYLFMSLPSEQNIYVLGVGKSGRTITIDNVLVQNSGFYKVEFNYLLERPEGTKQYGYVQSSAMPGVYSANRDVDLGTKSEGGYSKYVYYTYLKGGESNTITFDYKGTNATISSMRLTYVATQPVSGGVGSVAMKTGVYVKGKPTLSENHINEVRMLRGDTDANRSKLVYTLTVPTTGIYDLSGYIMAGNGSTVNVSVKKKGGAEIVSGTYDMTAFLKTVTYDGSEIALYVPDILKGISLEKDTEYEITMHAGTRGYIDVSAVFLSVGTHDHVYSDTPSHFPPSCTVSGYDSYLCTICGARDPARTTILPAIGHTPATDYVTDREPTCTEYGEKSIHCTVCKGSVEGTEELIPMKGHTYPEAGLYTLDTAATCSQNGVRSYHCTVCGNSIPGTEEVVKKTGIHSYHIVSVDASGTATLSCDVCGVPSNTKYTVDMTVPSYLVSASDITIAADGKTATLVFNNVEKAGIYYLKLKGAAYTGGDTNSAYIVATSGNGLVSKNRDTAAYGTVAIDGDGYSRYSYAVYLTVGNNTVTLATKGVKITAIAEARAALADTLTDSFFDNRKTDSAVNGTYTNTATLTADQDGIYELSALVGLYPGRNAVAVYTFTAADGTTFKVSYDLKKLQTAYQENENMKNYLLDGSSGSTPYALTLGYVYLAKGEYTVSVQITSVGTVGYSASNITYIPSK